MSEIGKRIKEIRKDRGLTQQKLSSKANVECNTLRKVETGKILNPGMDFLKKIAIAFDVGINDLVEESKPNVKGSDYLPLIKLSPERFEDLTEMIVQEDENYIDVERYGGRGDKSRDIIAKIKNDDSGYKVLFQAKRYKKITLTTLKDELDSIKEHFFTKKLNISTPIRDIKFCLADSPSVKIKDDTKDYAKELGIPIPTFWEERSVNLICKKSSKIMNEFFGGHIEEAKAGIKKINKTQSKNHDELSDKISVLTSSLSGQGRLISVGVQEDANMLKARRLIQEKKFSEAKDILLEVKPLLENSGDNLSSLKKLKALYNNLGVCLCMETSSGSIEKGLEYLERSILLDESFYHPKQNFVRIVLGNEIKERFDDSRTYANDLISAEPDNPEHISLYVMSLNAVGKFEDAKKFIENKFPSKEDFICNEHLFSNFTQTYFSLEDIESASKIVDIGLKEFPESISLNRFKGFVIMSEIEKGGALYRESDVIPFFLKSNDAKEAVNHFQKALLYASNDNWPEASINSIKVELYHASIISDRNNPVNFKKKIDDTILSNDQRKLKLTVEASQKLEEKKYSESFDIYEKVINDYNFSYADIKRIAEKFWRYGSPEISIKMLLPLYDEAKDVMDMEYWTLISVSYALIGRKNDALRFINEAKTIFVGDKDKYEQILSHYATLASRYKESESGRLVDNLFELHKIAPEKKILTPVEFLESDGGISQALKKILTNAKLDFERKRDIFLNNPIPISCFTKIFGRNFIEALNVPRSNADLKFIIPYNSPDSEFTSSQDECFNDSNEIIIDYFSLLNFSRSGHLGLFKSLGKVVMASEYLLFEVQKDLALTENESLREAWNFLRSDDVKLFTYQDAEGLDKKIIKNIEDIFVDSDWLIQSIFYCMKNKTSLLTDDLRLINIAKSQDIKVNALNSFVFFRAGLSRQLIDKKQYSLILGELAEFLMHFIPFNGEDLLNIVLDDEDRIRNNQILYFKYVEESPDLKISLRTYHLLNQSKLPNSITDSFLVVSLDFFLRLTKLGIMDEDKLSWAVFLSNFFYDPELEITRQYLIFTANIWVKIIDCIPGNKRNLIHEKSKFIKNDALREFISDKLKEAKDSVADL